MTNVYEVLRQKEAELQRLQKEIDALRAAVRVLEQSECRPALKPTPAVRPEVISTPGDHALRQFP